MDTASARTHIRKAVRLFYRQARLRRGRLIAPRRDRLIGVLVASLTRREDRPNAATRRALRDAHARRGLTRYDSFDDFARAMTGE